MINIKNTRLEEQSKKANDNKNRNSEFKIISKHVTNEETKNVEKVPKCEKPSPEKLIRW